jgi:hypothetical protein
MFLDRRTLRAKMPDAETAEHRNGRMPKRPTPRRPNIEMDGRRSRASRAASEFGSLGVW